MIDFEVDENGYPTDESIAAIEALNVDGLPIKSLAWFIADEFPKMAAALPCSTVTVTDIDNHGFPAKEIRFATGGWSGCEALIGAVLKHAWLRILYYAKWERGGLHVFIVPAAHLVPKEAPEVTSGEE